MISTFITPSSPSKILIVVTLVSYQQSHFCYSWLVILSKLQFAYDFQLPYAFYLGLVIHKAHILLGLGVSRCWIRIVSDTSPTHIITLIYVIFLNYYQCQRVRVVSMFESVFHILQFMFMIWLWPLNIEVFFN